MKFIRVIILVALVAVKQLSKKEQKRLEDEEFEKTLQEFGVQATSTSENSANQEEKKVESQTEIDEKKRLANLKKKEKKKAKKVEESKQETPAEQ